MNKGNLCRCCLARPPDKQLKTTYTINGKSEIYCDMLKECFEIHLLFGKEGDDGICNDCVFRLRNAADFKERVICSQKKLQTTFAKSSVKNEIDRTKVKMEFSDLDDESDDLDYDIKKEFLDDSTDEEVQTKVIAPECSNILKKTEKVIQKKPIESNKEVRKLISNVKMRVVKCKNERIKHEINLVNILKYSNCLPFSRKTMMGITCAYCNNSYKEISGLQTHYMETHKNRNDKFKRMGKTELTIKMDITDLKCTLCDNKFNYIKELKKHLTEVHNITFYPNNDFIYEFKMRNTQTYDCVYCNLNYETFKTLLQHMNGHYSNYICNSCGVGFINQYGLKTHMKTHDLGSYKCTQCDKVFTTLIKQKAHENYLHKPTQFVRKCPYCDEEFTSYYLRNSHLHSVHNKIPYKCNICDKIFLLKGKLTAHIKNNHLMERNHICNECGKGFFIKRLLDEHMISHNGPKIYKCDICNKAYARIKTLRNHIRIHTNDRRHKCGICSSAFVQKCSLRSHMLSNHGMTLAEYENGNE